MRIAGLFSALILSGYGFASAAHAACVMPSGRYTGAATGSYWNGSASVPVSLQIQISSFANGGEVSATLKSPEVGGAVSNKLMRGTVSLTPNSGTCNGALTLTLKVFSCIGAGCGPAWQTVPAIGPFDFLTSQNGSVVTLLDQSGGTVNPQFYSLVVPLLRP